MLVADDASAGGIRVNRHQLLRGLHEVLKPRTYFEIGVESGPSLTLSRTKSIAVDPFFNLTREIRCDVHLVRTTSDEFFARRHPLAHFDEPLIDLAFIDGMHLAEFALRDFMNVERFCHPGSVVVLDDMLPRHVDEAGRGREAGARRGAWAGDVYKVIDTLRAHRPDLLVLEMDTTPTGTVVILNTDPGNRTLDGVYDGLVEQYVTPDPQDVPVSVLERKRAIDGAVVIDSPVWSKVRELRSLPDAGAAIRAAYAAAGFANPV